MKNIAIFGSTGSIGKNALEVIKSLRKNNFPAEVKYLTGNSNVELLASQINEFRPVAAAIFRKQLCSELKERTSKSGCEILCGQEGINEIARRDDYNLALNALVGFSGLIPTIEAIKHGKDIALANKESLVVAGELITSMLRDTKKKLLPIDSEHSAILQSVIGEPHEKISKLILTASGGPFRDSAPEQMKNVTMEQALKHPNWKMGNKITIDSATLMNKGFEIIEAKWLFDIDIERIEVLIHPQSIVHSMVEFTDGSVKAQLGVPDMKIPIQYALTYPDRIASSYPRLELKHLANLTFEKPDFSRFECLNLAFEVSKMGGSYPVVLNGSNEAAVELFLKKEIKFLQIPYLIKKALDKHNNHDGLQLESIIDIDRWSKEFVYESAGKKHFKDPETLIK